MYHIARTTAAQKKALLKPRSYSTMNVVVSITPLLQNSRAIISLKVMNISTAVKGMLIQFCDDLSRYQIDPIILRYIFFLFSIAHDYRELEKPSTDISKALCYLEGYVVGSLGSHAREPKQLNSYEYNMFCYPTDRYVHAFLGS